MGAVQSNDQATAAKYEVQRVIMQLATAATKLPGGGGYSLVVEERSHLPATMDLRLAAQSQVPLTANDGMRLIARTLTSAYEGIVVRTEAFQRKIGMFQKVDNYRVVQLATEEDFSLKRRGETFVVTYVDKPEVIEPLIASITEQSFKNVARTPTVTVDVEELRISIAPSWTDKDVLMIGATLFSGVEGKAEQKQEERKQQKQQQPASPTSVVGGGLSSLEKIASKAASYAAPDLAMPIAMATKFATNQGSISDLVSAAGGGGNNALSDVSRLVTVLVAGGDDRTQVASAFASLVSSAPQLMQVVSSLTATPPASPR